MRPLVLALAAAAALTSVAPMLSAQDVSPLQPRYAVAVVDTGNDALNRTVSSAAVRALRGLEDAVILVQSIAVRNTLVDTRRELSERAWRDLRAELLVLLRTTPTTEEQNYVVEAWFIEPDGAERGYWSGPITIDAPGRYLQEEQFSGLVETANDLRDVAEPAVILTVESNGPMQIHGLPHWVRVRNQSSDKNGDRVVHLRLRAQQDYQFTVLRDNHRPEVVHLSVGRQDRTVRVDLVPYPRHTVSFFLRGLSWPGLEYGWYPADTQWTVRFGVTSYVAGLTPFRQIARDDTEPRALSSYGLTELELGWHWLLGEREEIHRWAIGGGIATRLVHGVVDFGFDPIIPVLLRFSAGSEWEFHPRFILSQRFTSDLFLSPRDAFVPLQPWLRKIGPMYSQLPVYRIGVRVRL